MERSLAWHVTPTLHNGTLALAFEGWNDAGDAATTALRFLDDAVQAVPLAEIDPEEFFDFTVRRPELTQVDGEREIVWPSTRFRYGSIDDQRELVLGFSVEPHARWRSYCDEVMALCNRLGVTRVVLLGAYLAEVVYSQPVPVQGFGSDAERLLSLGVEPSGYQGPTGIVGVLAERMQREGLEVVSLWAALPHYIQVAPNPRGALALIQKVGQWLDLKLDEAPLRVAAAEFEQEISQLVANNTELSEYVRQLKRREFAQ